MVEYQYDSTTTFVEFDTKQQFLEFQLVSAGSEFSKSLSEKGLLWLSLIISCLKYSNGERFPCPTLLGFHMGKQGSNPNRGRSSVKWRDFPSVCPSICPFPPLGHPAWPEAQPEA